MDDVQISLMIITGALLVGLLIIVVWGFYHGGSERRAIINRIKSRPPITYTFNSDGTVTEEGREEADLALRQEIADDLGVPLENVKFVDSNTINVVE